MRLGIAVPLLPIALLFGCFNFGTNWEPQEDDPTNQGCWNHYTGAPEPCSTSYDAQGEGNTQTPEEWDTYWHYEPLDPACEGAGAGPDNWSPEWEVGMFPIKPILELYQETQCRTISPAFISRLVSDLAGYMSGASGLTLSARPCFFVAAAEELTGYDSTFIADMLGCSWLDLAETLKRGLKLYVLQAADAENRPLWDEWVNSLSYGYLVGDSVGKLALGLTLTWGVETLAGCLDLEPEVVQSAADSGTEALYYEVLGVSKSEALQLLEDHGVKESDELLGFLSIVHVSPLLDGQRSAYVFVADNSLTPIEGLVPAHFKVTEGGVEVPSDKLLVRSLESLSSTENTDVQFSLSIIMDYSGSMSDQDKGFLEQGLLYMFDVLPPVLRASVTKFSDYAVTYQEMTSDVAAIKRAISDPMAAGSTALYDALGTSMDTLAKETTPFRLVLLFTDGKENASQTQCYDSVVLASREQLIPLFVIGMGQISVPLMFSLTNDTNGCFLYAPSNEELEKLYQMIGGFIANTYVVTWPAATETKSAPVFIEVTPPPEIAETTGGAMSDTWTPPTL